jgi:hypothetical protein
MMRAMDLHQPRWDGRPGRLEVWYTTATDTATGTGLWLHHEVVAPTDGSAAYAHGWVTIFPPGQAPVCERFGPHPVEPGTAPFAGPSVTAGARRLQGAAGRLSWDLAVVGGGAPLHTFARWAWERDVLPATHVVPQPAARLTGRLRVDGQELRFDGPGASARIYGHGNAARWAWLHADLGRGDVLEVVSAVSRRAGMRRLRPLPFVQLRLGGIDWPRHPLLAAPLFRAEPALPEWTVRGAVGRHRLTAHVRLDPAACVALDYRDPDGSPAVCTNSERASATVVLERRAGAGWQVLCRWQLDGTAHAEVGLREPPERD